MAIGKICKLPDKSKLETLCPFNFPTSFFNPTTKMKEYIQKTKEWLLINDSEGELWKPIAGYEGIYEVSNLGRVKRLAYSEKIYKSGVYPYVRQHADKILKGSISKSHGYYVVTLTKNGESKHYLCHRLVAEAFIPNPDNLPFINHKDETRLNNRADNLEWCTPLYNTRYGDAILRSVNSRAKSKKGWKRVFQYDIYGNFIASYESINEVEKKNGFKSISISNSCHKYNTKRFGFYWRFENDGYVYGESLTERSNRLQLKDDDRDSLYYINKRILQLPINTKYKLTIDGKTKPISVWARIIGKSRNWLLRIYQKNGNEYAINLVKDMLKVA